jgi:DNA-binding transcriptional LysR family regulator
MELIQLRYFITAAQFQNLSKAAQKMNVTQPALSKSISKLEDELGIRLFDRSGKRVTLSKQGKMFLEHAESSIRKLDDAAASVKYSLITNPTIYIGLLHHSDKFMCCFKEFSHSNPEIGFHLEYLNIASDDIDTNVFDMLIYPKNPAFRKYKGEVIYSDPYLLAVNESDPLAREESVRLTDLASRKLIFIRHDSALFDLPYHQCVGCGVNVSGGIYANNYELQRWLISNDCGIGFVPGGSAGIFLSGSDIKLLPVADEGMSQDIMMGFKREKHLSDAGLLFASFVRGYFGI